MNYSDEYTERADEIAALFTATFTNSEGAAEGELIGNLANDLMAKTENDDLFVFSALEGQTIVGTIIFTRLTYPDDERTVFVLAPVAVATSHQGKGVGRALLSYGLKALKANGVDVAITYGDINFYTKVGFAPISEEVAKSPLPLQYPEGWLGQALTAPSLEPLKGQSHCVDALNDSAYW